MKTTYARALMGLIATVVVFAAAVPGSAQGPDDDAFVYLPLIRTPAGRILINEFMAVNDTTLMDEDGEFSDWIELYNPGPEPVDLEGRYLTDDAAELTKWEFPAVTLEAGAYLVIFASDKDRRDSASELHTNFRLSGDGEYLGLIGSNGATVIWEYAPTFPPQSADVSFGLDSALMPRFFNNPTPGAANDEQSLP